MRTDLYDDVDDDCTIYIEHVSSADMSRHDSSSSADIFLPNYGVQRSTSCVEDQVNSRSVQATENSRPSSALQNRDSSYRSQLSVPYLPGGAKNSSQESLASESKYLTVPGNQASRDAPENVDPSELDYGSQDEDPEPNTAESKFRPNQRRVGRGERRYRTADTIQDLNSRKDRNIQKRLSWNCGNSANLEDKEKMFAGESMRSVPSSSGVSSTVSLHVGADGDTRYRAAPLDGNDFESDLMDQLGPCHFDGCPHMTNSPRKKSVETQTAKSDWRNAVDDGEGDRFDEKASLDNERSNSLSKSLPNIAGLVLASCSGQDLVDLGDGEVDLPAASMPSTPRIPHRRSLSGSQMTSGMNRELLLFNSTLEAS